MEAKPSSRDFVALLHDEGVATRLGDELADLVDVEPVPGHPLLLLLRTPEGQPEPVSLASLRQHVGDRALVEPVLIDERGEPRLPTGKIRVRFRQAPSEEEIADFATRHHLAVQERSRYVPSQVDFGLANDEEATVLESVANIEQDEAVERSWPDTLQQYWRL